MSGTAFGLRLSLEEVVGDYDPPRHKSWETRRGWLIARLASWYAAWCTQRMVNDAVAYFTIHPISNESLAQR
jgi:hypothetical protein